jgi:hypothetical protein
MELNTQIYYMHTYTIYTNNVCMTRLHLTNLIPQRQKGFKILFCHTTEKTFLTFLVTDSISTECNSHKLYSQNRCSVKCSGILLLLHINAKIENACVQSTFP